MSYATRLADCQAAITAVMKAQSYTFEGRSVTRADLDSLVKLEQWLEGKAAREGRSGPRMVGVSIRHSS